MTVCKAMAWFTITELRRLFDESVTLFELGNVTAIEAYRFDRFMAGRRYARRTEYRFIARKTTPLTNYGCGAILNMLCPTSRPYDTQIGGQVLTRNLDRMLIVMADKGLTGHISKQ